jgi:aminoglycoside/choline kinase family phosphotransferase
MNVPATIGDVTAEWLAEAMGIAIESIDVAPIAAGEGFMGQLARVRIQTADADVDAPASVIVKLATADPGGRAIGEMMRVWEREHAFYRDVAPLMSVRVPQAYVNIAEPPCLVLEDLAPAVPGDHVAGATIDQARRSIDVLARHHAHWFEHPLLPTLAWLPGLDDPSIQTIGPIFQVGWPTFQQRYDGELPERTMRWCEQFVVDVQEWIATHADEPVTLIHGDFRLDNLFFGAAVDDADGSTSVAVIDWQLSMRAPGQTDLVYFCANNLTVEMRRQYEDELIERYVAGLHAHGVPTDAVTVEGVRRGYLEGLLFYAMTFGASLLTIDPANERGAALFDALVRRTFTAVDDLDVGTVLGYS